MGGPASPKNPFSRSEPELPDFKKPSLRLEHIDSIAELSQIYLKADATEFSEDDLLANLPKLWTLSLSSKMTPRHSKKLQTIVSFVAGPPQDKAVAALKEKASSLGRRNEHLEEKISELKDSISLLQKMSSSLNGKNERLQEEIALLKTGLSALRASSEKQRQSAQELAARHKQATEGLEGALEQKRQLLARVGRLELELHHYEQAVLGASALLGKAKKK